MKKFITILFMPILLIGCGSVIEIDNTKDNKDSDAYDNISTARFVERVASTNEKIDIGISDKVSVDIDWSSFEGKPTYTDAPIVEEPTETYVVTESIPKVVEQEYSAVLVEDIQNVIDIVIDNPETTVDMVDEPIVIDERCREGCEYHPDFEDCVCG